ncbi:hypothetical protein OED01_13740 [Microbacterium sp. M28]|uniref:hypothetical protein n=1 Tax=Microbacterium sp. M28 TaxID=2962064 RepID=UPI0021F4C530|nr:hypothetical protein [Microbacterium sp. M28]UYO96650.1 hypothetical protein OED01_13740 [Microbacterium sp. M28]
MSEFEEVAGEEPRARRRWMPFAILGVLAVAGAAIAIAVTMNNAGTPATAPTESPVTVVDDGDDDAASEDPLASVTAPTPAPLGDDVEAESERAMAAVEILVTAADEIAERGDGSAVGLESVATGWALGELQAKAREQFDLGYTQTGKAVVSSVAVIDADLEATPAVITMRVCVDASDIDVHDAAGNSLKDSLYDPGRPVAHLYGAVFEDDTWKISTHDIPDVQDCAAA